MGIKGTSSETARIRDLITFPGMVKEEMEGQALFPVNRETEIAAVKRKIQEMCRDEAIRWHQMEIEDLVGGTRGDPASLVEEVVE